MFVIDSSDKLRFAVAKTELESLFEEPEISQRPIPILFFANKMDQQGVAKESELTDFMELKSIKDRPWQVQQSNALTG